MSALRVLLFASASVFAAPAVAADQLKFGPPPAWVVQRPLPQSADADQSTPVQFLASDQQTWIDEGKSITYSMNALKVQTPEGLQVGNLSLPWDPARQTVTIHKVEILRDGKTIDVLASQQFTTLRREQNLEAAMLDGVLTANIQPEGLEVGDILVVATSTEHVDPVMKGHVETGFGNWDGVPIAAAYSRISWPEKMRVQFRSVGGLPEGRTTTSGSRKVFDISARDVQPTIPPKGAPPRFHIGRQGEATTFRSWGEVADLMRPLFETAAVIPKTGPLRDELEKIRSATSDPVQRTEKALDLVEHRVRYVALLMGQGGYVPATAETSWSRRFGDCKAKSALLLALLKELGIAAEPVLVNIEGGDGLDQRLPMAAHFNHVIVRANIGGKTYWLDGTRTGDAKLSTIDTPFYRWGLPLIKDAQLVSIVPQPYVVPQSERVVRIDASKGIYAPATMAVEQLFRGDAARHLNTAYLAMTAAQRAEQMRQFWQRQYTYLTVGPVQFKYDGHAAELRLTASGTAKLEWEDGWFYLPGSTLAYEPTFERPEGPQRDAPVALGFPSSERSVTEISLPESFLTSLHGKSEVGDTINEQVGGVRYSRKMRLVGNRLIMEAQEQALVPELSYRDAMAAVPRLRQLNNDEIQLRVPSSYVWTKADLEVRKTEKPQTAQAFSSRGVAYAVAKDFGAALADFDEAVRLDPKNPLYLAQRARMKAQTRDFRGAEADTKAALSIQPDFSFAMFTEAMIAGLQQDSATAISILSRLLSKEPGNTEALKGRAGSYLLVGDVAAAEKDVEALKAISPSDPDLLELQTDLAARHREPHVRVESLSGLVKAHPGNVHILVARAAAHRAANDVEKALDDVARAIELEPENTEARLLRANLLRLAGKTKESVQDADYLVSSNPETGYPLVVAAKIYAAEGLREKAMVAIDKALALKPESYIYVNRAQIRPTSDRQARLADLDEALKLEPDFEEALYLKSKILRTLGDWPGTATLLGRLEKLVPQQADYYRVDRAIVMDKACDKKEADRLFAELEQSAKTAQQFNNLCWEKATADCAWEGLTRRSLPTTRHLPSPSLRLR